MLKPEEVEKLKVGDILKFIHLDKWEIVKIDNKYVYLKGLEQMEGCEWELFKRSDHPQWKGFNKVS